jgi:hypothetical protein
VSAILGRKRPRGFNRFSIGIVLCLVDCGQCEAVIGRGEVAYAVKDDEARTVYCSVSCAKENGYVDLLN